MKNLITRTLSGTVFLVLIIGTVLIGPLALLLLCALFSVLALSEYHKLTGKLSETPAEKAMLIFTGILVFFSISLSQSGFIPFKYGLVAICVLIPLVIFTLLSEKNNPLTYLSLNLFGLCYIIIPFSLLPSFYFLHAGRAANKELLTGFFILLWANDVFAYLIGSLIGKRKLLEKISPKKTLEGSIAGILMAMAASYGISLFFKSMVWEKWLILALLISTFALLGDLMESMFKRQANVKDSGKIMPGHGGVLDRFDSFLLAVPAVYVYLILAG